MISEEYECPECGNTSAEDGIVMLSLEWRCLFVEGIGGGKAVVDYVRSQHLGVIAADCVTSAVVPGLGTNLTHFRCPCGAKWTGEYA